MANQFDLRQAINAVSDVVVNRPPPLRDFDQIYMKVADMVIQAHFISERFDKKDVVFIGDGDAIALSVMHLGKQKLFEHCPNSIHVLDFDERIVNSITRFAEKYEISDRISSDLYNVVNPLETKYLNYFDAFYTNPPWGASNGGESVLVFLERGIEATKEESEGVIVIADDSSLSWTQQVLLDSQRHAAKFGYVVAELIPHMHSYHLDDNPELKSCCCVFRSVERDKDKKDSTRLSDDRVKNFYGRKHPLTVEYVKQKIDLNYGKAQDDTYELKRID